MAVAEMARVDASCGTFLIVHSSLAMLTIGKFCFPRLLSAAFMTQGPARAYHPYADLRKH